VSDAKKEGGGRGAFASVDRAAAESVQLSDNVRAGFNTFMEV
jgi:hypothetical protein